MKALGIVCAPDGVYAAVLTGDPDAPTIDGQLRRFSVQNAESPSSLTLVRNEVENLLRVIEPDIMRTRRSGSFPQNQRAVSRHYVEGVILEVSSSYCANTEFIHQARIAGRIHSTSATSSIRQRVVQHFGDVVRGDHMRDAVSAAWAALSL